MSIPHFTCPHCRQKLQLAAVPANGLIRCPKCATVLRVGGNTAAAVTPTPPPPPAPSVPIARPAPAPTASEWEFEEAKKTPAPRVVAAPAPRRRTPPPRSRALVLGLVIGGGVLVLAVAGLIGWLASDDTGDRKTAAAARPTAKTAPTPAKAAATEKAADPRPEGPPSVADAKPPITDPKPEPTRTTPPVEAAPPAPLVVGALPGDVLQRVKKATVLVRVAMPDGAKATGTGFFAAPTTVLTNAHVVGLLEASALSPKSVEIVLDSGAAGERFLPAEVAAVDRANDLAALRVRAAKGTQLPAPLALASARGLQETQEVFVFGFPFGEALGKDITVSKSSVSSLRKDGDGRLARVQVNGGMHPGNSGGPVVDGAGRVVGVAVAVLRNTQINFAIPGDLVTGLLDWRFTEVRVGETVRKGDGYAVPVTFQAVDPLGRIGDVSIEGWVGKGASEPRTLQFAHPWHGETRLTSVKASFDPVSGTGTAELVLPTLPPTDRSLWVCPVATAADGRSLRGNASPFSVEPPVEARAAELTSRPSPGKRPLVLESQLTLRVSGARGPGQTVVARYYVHFTEETTAAQADGNVPVRLEIQRLLVGRSRDENELPEALLRDLTRFGAALRLAHEVDRQGNPLAEKVDLKEVIPDLRDETRKVASDLQAMLASTAVSLPNATIQPGETWRATRTGPATGSVGGPSAGLDMTYTFRGVRTVGGRSLAAIDLRGTPRFSQGRDRKAGGAAHGSAVVDLATGQTARVALTTEVRLDHTGEDGTVRLYGEKTVRLWRGPDVPAEYDEDLNPLEGGWMVVEEAVDGHRSVYSGGNYPRVRLSAGLIQFHQRDGNGHSWVYVLRPDIGPGAFDLLPPRMERGRASPGIYEVDGDTLRLCVNVRGPSRPTAYTSEPGSGHFLKVLRRWKAMVGKTPSANYPPPPRPVDPIVRYTEPRPGAARFDDSMPAPRPPTTQPEPAKVAGEVRRFRGFQPVGSVGALAFSTDGRRLAAANDSDRAIVVWDVASGKEVQRLTAPDLTVRALAFAPDGKRLVSGGGTFRADGTLAGCFVRLWDLETGKETRQFAVQEKMVTAVAFLPDGRRFLSTAADGAIRLWDVSQTAATRGWACDPGLDTGLTLSADGKRVLTYGSRSTVLWDVDTGRELLALATPRTVQSAAFHPDGRRALTTVFGSGRLVLWDLTRGTEAARATVKDVSLERVVLSADGRRALTHDRLTGLRLYDVETLKELHLIKHPKPVGFGASVLSGDGQRAAVVVAHVVVLLDLSGEK